MSAIIRLMPGEPGDTPPREALRPLAEHERLTLVRLLPSAQDWDSLHALLLKEGVQRDLESLKKRILTEGKALFDAALPEIAQQLKHTNVPEVSHLAAVLYAYTHPRISAFEAFSRANAFFHSSVRERRNSRRTEPEWEGWD